MKTKKEKTIADLAAMFYGTPIDDLERSLMNQEDIIEDPEKEELDEYLDSVPIIESPMNEGYEEPERKGDEELPPPELKPLLDGLRYEFLDDSNKYPIIISTDLSEE